MNKLLTVILVISAGAFISAADGDGFFTPMRQVDSRSYAPDITEPSQKALIMHYDGIERMALQVSFKGNVSKFAWLVPTPSRPKVTAVKKPIFHALHQRTAPEVRYWLDADRRMGSYSMKGLPMGAMGAPDLNVTVLEEKTVGAYDIAVLKAGDASDLLTWLKGNDYMIPDGLSVILADYVKRGWIFTAMRVNVGMQAKSASKLRNGVLGSLLFTFKTDKPVYPLKISSMNKGNTDLLLYVVSKHRVTSPLLETQCALFWEPYSYASWLADERSLNQEIDSSMILTKLSGVLSASRMTHDLTLEQAPSDDYMEPAPTSPPFLANIGAVTKLFLDRLVLYPVSLSVLALTGVIALTPFGIKRWKTWVGAGLVYVAGTLIAFGDRPYLLRRPYSPDESYFVTVGTIAVVVLVLAVLTPLTLVFCRRIKARKRQEHK